MKKWIALLLILSTFLLLPGCDVSDSTSKGDGPSYDDVWADIMDGYVEPQMEQHEYGTFDGWRVLLTILSGSGTTHLTGSIGGSSFDIPAGYVLQAYKDGTLMTLEKAYSEGYISDESIAKIAEIHRAYVEERQEEQQLTEELFEVLRPFIGIDISSFRFYGEDNGYHIIFAEVYGERRTTIWVAGFAFYHPRNFILIAY